MTRDANPRIKSVADAISARNAAQAAVGDAIAALDAAFHADINLLHAAQAAVGDAIAALDAAQEAVWATAERNTKNPRRAVMTRAYGRSNASAALRDGPLAWLGELDLIDADDRGPKSFVPAALVEIRAAMLELERTGAWYDPRRHVLCFPSLSAPDDWGLMYLGPGPENTRWREVRIEVDRW